MMIGDDDLDCLDEAWRPPSATTAKKGPLSALLAGAALGRRGRTGGGAGGSRRAKLARLAGGAPEVMVKVSGRQRGGEHTAAHLAYIGRHGKLEVETSDGEHITNKARLEALAEEWALSEAFTTRRRDPLTSVSLILSMPPGTEPDTVRAAAQAFARIELDVFPYAMALHTDEAHPHVHVTVAARGEGGERFNPRKADLARWRESFARELRARGVEAEATPRRARGVVQKAHKTAVRKMRERWQAGAGTEPAVVAGAEAQARAMAAEATVEPRAYEVASLVRQAEVRAGYATAARKLAASGDPDDRLLGLAVERFVDQMPDPVIRDRQRSRTGERAPPPSRTVAQPNDRPEGRRPTR
jgi:hypothetical protein